MRKRLTVTLDANEKMMTPQLIALLKKNNPDGADMPRAMGGAMSGRGLQQTPPSPEDVTHVSAWITYR
jgi:hypothetical protein